MAVATVAIIVQRNLFAVVVLSGVYSFLMASVLVALDAVDVAMTEASVGAGVSTVLLLGALYLCGGEEAKPFARPWLPLAISIVTGGVLVYGSLGLPAFSDPKSPMHVHVVPRYVEQGRAETGVPNIVTAVLASYRGYDTLGETTVVFTAGAGVIALLRRRVRKDREKGVARDQSENKGRR
jgi:multicomponent Na+:H+ antiporter subunit B